MDATRYLLVVADDFGMGPATSRGILDLAAQGLVTGTVLLVNSPYAEDAVKIWKRSGIALEVGWHPCLNLDRPVLPPERVPSLVNPDGTFLSLGALMARVALRRINPGEVVAELRAQYGRFHDLVGRPPALVNSHKHVQIFPPVGAALLEVLGKRSPLPYLRRVCEPWKVIRQVPGGRVKRAFLNALGRNQASKQIEAGFPGNDWLAGVTNPSCVADPDFLVRWLRRVPGEVVELTCHPGHHDPTLVGRDCPVRELERRTREMHLLRQPSFKDVCRAARFTLVSASELARLRSRGVKHAA